MADKLDMRSMDITQGNIEKIRALFPSAVTEVKDEEGNVKLAIDFDALRQELSADLVSDKAERYQMTWPDKSKAKVLANSRITATLRPNREKSVDFDTTENLYIEGDIFHNCSSIRVYVKSRSLKWYKRVKKKGTELVLGSAPFWYDSCFAFSQSSKSSGSGIAIAVPPCK